MTPFVPKLKFESNKKWFVVTIYVAQCWKKGISKSQSVVVDKKAI